MHQRFAIARAAAPFLLVIFAGAAHAVEIITTMLNTSTWVTFYQAGASWVGAQANSGCITGGKGEMRAAITSNEYYLRTEVMASGDCKGTRICDTRMRVSGQSRLYVNQSARDANNCFISDKDQSGETYVGPGIAACIASLPVLGGQVDAEFAKARARNQIDAPEAARFQAVRATAGKSGQLYPLRVVSLAQCRADAGDLQELQKVVTSMATPLPEPYRRIQLGPAGAWSASAQRQCDIAQENQERLMNDFHGQAQRDGRLDRVGAAEFAALRSNLEKVWKERVAARNGDKLYACDERSSLVHDLDKRLRLLAF
jgi:hypothetical protein